MQTNFEGFYQDLVQKICADQRLYNAYAKALSSRTIRLMGFEQLGYKARNSRNMAPFDLDLSQKYIRHEVEMNETILNSVMRSAYHNKITLHEITGKDPENRSVKPGDTVETSNGPLEITGFEVKDLPYLMSTREKAHHTKRAREALMQILEYEVVPADGTVQSKLQKIFDDLKDPFETVIRYQSMYGGDALPLCPKGISPQDAEKLTELARVTLNLFLLNFTQLEEGRQLNANPNALRNSTAEETYDQLLTQTGKNKLELRQMREICGGSLRQWKANRAQSWTEKNPQSGLTGKETWQAHVLAIMPIPSQRRT